MKITELQVKINEEESSLKRFETENDMDMMRKMRNQYSKLQRDKKLNSLGKRMQQKLRDASSGMRKYGNKKKIYNS